MINCPNCGFNFDSNPTESIISDYLVNTTKEVETVSTEVLAVPTETLVDPEPVRQEVVQKDTGVKKAEPKVSEYRERFKKHSLRADDVTPQKAMPKIVHLDGELDRFTHKGESLFFGEGTQVEY